MTHRFFEIRTIKRRNPWAYQRTMAARLGHWNRIEGCIALFCIALAIAGSVRAQGSNPAIEQSRLFPRTLPPGANTVSVEGIGLPEGETTTSEDEGFGAQQILKPEERIPDFPITRGSTGLLHQ